MTHLCRGNKEQSAAVLMASNVVNTDQLWRDGYLLLAPFLPSAALDSLSSQADVLFGSLRDEAREAGRLPSPWSTFKQAPFGVDAIDDVVFHPTLSQWAQEVLGTADIRLTKANIWRKTGGDANYEQPMHRDYPDQDLLGPVSNGSPDQVAFLMYLEDVDQRNGPTAVVPRISAPSIPMEVAELAPDMAPGLYAAERPVHAERGATLVLLTDTWHRATDLQEPGSKRTLLVAGFRRADAEWCGAQCWPSYGKDPSFRSLLARLTPDQRTLLGFPSAGSARWISRQMSAVVARYPGISL